MAITLKIKKFNPWHNEKIEVEIEFRDEIEMNEAIDEMKEREPEIEIVSIIYDCRN